MGKDAIYFQPYSFEVAAGGVEFLEAYGRYLTLLANDQTDKIKIKVGNMMIGELPKGTSIELPPGDSFHRIAFINDYGSDMAIEVAVSMGKIHFNELAQIDTLLTAIRNELQGGTLMADWNRLSLVATTATQVLAANTSRKSFIVQSRSSNVEEIFLGTDNTLSGTKGFAALTPGQVLGCDDYRGAVWAYSNGAGQQLYYGEVA